MSVRHGLRCCLALGFFWIACGLRGEDACTLVDEGCPRAAIVLAARPTRVAQMAAAELTHYVEKLAGCTLPVVREDQLTDGQAAGFLVLVGPSRRTQTPGLIPGDLKSQEHVIRNAGRWLVLVGRDEEDYGEADYGKDLPWPECRLDFPWRVQFKGWGSMYAVDTFLERVCGVRWYLPGPIGEVVPGMRTIRAAGLDLRLRPWTKTRIVGGVSAWDPADFYTPGREPKREVTRRDMLLWWLRMKMGGEPWNVNHSVYSYYDRFAQSHPEWFADGKPKRAGHLCYTHPEFIAQHAQDARDYFDGKYPTMNYPKGGQVPGAGQYYPAVPIDSSGGWCDCPRCKALLAVAQPVPAETPGAGFFNGRYSQYVWTFANEVAREVRKTHPDRRISAIAYARYFLPPRDIELEPNLSICITKQVMLYGDPAAKEYFNETLRQWHRRVGELFIWEYYLNQYFSRFCEFPWIAPHVVAEDIAFLKTVGVAGKFVEISGWKGRRANMAEDLLTVYVTMKLLADDRQSVDEILDEHYRLFYGPATAPMKDFFQRIERAWQSRPDAVAEKIGAQRRSWEILCPAGELPHYREPIRRALALAAEEPFASRVRLMHEAIYRPMESHCLEFAERSKSRREMACPVLASAPAIDGRLDDPAWRTAAVTPAFVGMTGEALDVKTVARIGRDDKMLYVAVDCPEPNMAELHATHDKPDSTEIAIDDDVEVFIDVGRTRRQYYHLLIGANGVLADRAVGMGLDDGGIGWNSGATVKTFRSPQGWTVEAAIPLASMQAAPKPGDAWGFNVCRSRRAGIKEMMGQPAGWSPTYGGFNVPDEFGVLTMSGPGTGPR